MLAPLPAGNRGAWVDRPMLRPRDPSFG